MRTILSLALRIAIGAGLCVGVLWAVDWYFGTDYLGAIWRLVIWFSRALFELVVRMVGTVWTSGATMLRATTQRLFWRRMTRFAWRLFAVIFLVWWLGEIRLIRYERVYRIGKYRFVKRLKRLVRAKPNWPRSVRAMIAVFAISFLTWAYFWISDHIGEWWGLAASIVFVEMMAYIRVLGLDALVSWFSEKWAPVKRFIQRHQWIRWLWLGPFFAWVFGRIEGIKDWHGQRYKGKGKLDEWRERRRAKKDREKAAGAY